MLDAGDTMGADTITQMTDEVLAPGETLGEKNLTASTATDEEEEPSQGPTGGGYKSWPLQPGAG